uniref:Metallothionein n=1 Tax=Picea sitchensis TaxID=3332 RepID=A9NXR0_PICSI|nr:unknown [Picea sitchensis]
MSSDCGNCDCADKSQCTKKGFQIDGIVETSYEMGYCVICSCCYQFRFMVSG